jgi:hypothetical protein
MDLNSTAVFIKSKAFLAIIGMLLVLGLMLGSFSVGMAVGYHKARNSFAWGENYNRVFAGPRGGFLGDMMRDIDGRDYIDAHGVFGQVVKTDTASLVISGRDGLERVVLLTPDTIVRKFRDDISAAEVKVGDTVVVVGAPDESGSIQAELIRIMPPMPPATAQPTLLPR